MLGVARIGMIYARGLPGHIDQPITSDMLKTLQRSQRHIHRAFTTPVLTFPIENILITILKKS